MSVKTRQEGRVQKMNNPAWLFVSFFAGVLFADFMWWVGLWKKRR